MKHASERTLIAMKDFLDEVRAMPGLRERKLGVFYRKGRAFLHFHEDSAGVFADVRLGASDFDRFPVSSSGQRREVLKRISQVCRE